MRDFSDKEGINPHTLAWWRWNLKRTKENVQHEPRFAELVVAPSVEDPVVSATPETRALTIIVGGAQITVNRSSDLELLRAVVEVLA